MTVVVRVPAKINVQLSVGPLREDGFHDVVTVYQAVSLTDTITARSGPGVRLSISGEGASSLPVDQENLAVQAAMLLAEHTGTSADVHLEIAKAIPVAGGMAGGSADAAGALVACNTLWGTQLERDELLGLAARLGSDVPFGLLGGNALGRGRGEDVTPILGRGSFHWVLGLADGGLSTPAVYARCDDLRAGATVTAADADPDLIHALHTGDAPALGACLQNDLQPAALSLRPQLAEVLAVGADVGAVAGLVSGSGPTCVFLARDEAHATDVAVALTSTGVCRQVRRAMGPVPGARVTPEADEPGT